MLEMENLIAHLDAIVEHSRDQHLHVKSKHAQAMEDSVVLAVMLDEGSGDEGSGDEGSVAAEVGDVSARQPNHEGIITFQILTDYIYLYFTARNPSAPFCLFHYCMSC
jgi:hypothetical protein